EGNCSARCNCVEGRFDGEDDGSLEIRREENCREGLVGLGSQQIVGRELRSTNRCCERILLNSRLPRVSTCHLQNSTGVSSCICWRVTCAYLIINMPF
ncbi:hypothetical protein QBC38DRAFT_360409, partial [Podospora fimiseda]